MKLTCLCLMLCALEPFCKADCQSTFSAGSGKSAVQWCVSSNGNISQFYVSNSNVMVPLINGEENYAISSALFYCDRDGFGQSTIVQPNGPNTMPLTISRTTTDGMFTLDQSYTWLSTRAGISVRMKITPHGPNGYGLIRYAHFVGDSFPKYADITLSTASAWTQIQQGATVGGVGMVAAPQPDSTTAMVILPMDICTEAPSRPNVPYQGDAATYLSWGFRSGAHSGSFTYSALR